MASVTVEVADLSAASRTMARGVADPLFTRVSGDLEPLMTAGGMAGDDPPALHWAAGYDRAAPAAITAAEDVINACYRVSAMLAATARNYANAETASTVAGHRTDPAVQAAVTSLPDDTRIGLPSGVPSASAGAGNPDLPPGWHFLAHHLGGYLWPNGHQDRLHRAAAAWHASAAALEDYAFDATIVDLGPLIDRLPEGPDIATVCNALGDHLHAVARAHRGLGHACTQLATHIDQAHAQVRHEITELLAWTAGIQTVGALASVFSFGAAEAPTQGAELSRIAETANAIVTILREFALAVKTLALSLGPLTDAAADVRAAVAWLRELRIVEVEVTAVPGMRVYSIARVEGTAGAAATTTEIGSEEAALTGLTQESTAAERAARWKRTKQFESKFKHAKAFGVVTPRGTKGFAEFESAVDTFLADPSTVTIEGTYRPQAALLHYNPENQKIVIETVDGEFVSAWRMTPSQLERVQQKGEIGFEP